MIISIGQDKLFALLCNQLRHSFLLDQQELAPLQEAVSRALPRAERCFGGISNKYYRDDEGRGLFNPYHSGQYGIFLYFLAQEALALGQRSLADRLYYLNKMLNAFDLYYETALPEVFFMEHPVGSVMGRARYGNHLVIQQNCTVGGNGGIYPTLGDFVWLFANATVVGNSTLGNNVFVSANSYIKDQDIPDNSLVFGSSPNLVIKQKPSDYFHRLSPFFAHRGADA